LVDYVNMSCLTVAALEDSGSKWAGRRYKLVGG
jgi:hypothetical protein